VDLARSNDIPILRRQNLFAIDVDTTVHRRQINRYVRDTISPKDYARSLKTLINVNHRCGFDAIVILIAVGIEANEI